MKQYEQLEVELKGALRTLESIIKEKLDNYGIYYRMFSRVKTGDSIEKKLLMERYQNDKERKIKDLFGIRITLYYQDDIEVCKRILENMLINVRWKESENDTTTFDATKNNGIFLLPGFVKSVVEPKIADLRIEPTFEIQLRTVYFEGWHEAEHDMRYKEEKLWEDFPKKSRKLNSVLATLEICDHYMITLFDDVGHDLYKVQNWGQMIRFKYRLRTLNGTLDPGMEQWITPELGKKIFKWSKKDFIDLVIESEINRLDADIIVYLVNEKLKDTPYYVPQIAEEYSRIKRNYAKNRERLYEKNIVSLKEEKAFEATVVLDSAEESEEEDFQKILDVVYESWMKRELLEQFPETFERSLHTFSVRKEGVACSLQYDLKQLQMQAVLSHIGIDEPGKMWTTKLLVCRDEKKRLVFNCENTFAKPENSGAEVLSYSRPKVYAEVAKQIGFLDVWRLSDTIEKLETEQMNAFEQFLENPKRRFPVLLITVSSAEEQQDYDSCYGRIVDYTRNPRMPEQNNLMRKVGNVCHVYYMCGKTAAKMAEKLGEETEAYRNGIRFFASGFQFAKKIGYTAFSEQEIYDKPKDIYALRTKAPYFYQTVSGPDAVRHEVIQMVYKHILNKDNSNMME